MKIHHFAGVAGMLLASTQQPQAVPITGSIGIVGNMTFNTSSPSTATADTSWITPEVASDSGVFQIAVNTAVTMSSAIWNFNTGTPINNFWSVDGFTFELLSSQIASQGTSSSGAGYLDVNGTGMVSGNGYTPTVMSFNLTTQNPSSGAAAGTQPVWTFSASGMATSAVADGGYTLMLLGLALTGTGLMARKTMRSNCRFC